MDHSVRECYFDGVVIEFPSGETDFAARVTVQALGKPMADLVEANVRVSGPDDPATDVAFYLVIICRRYKVRGAAACSYEVGSGRVMNYLLPPKRPRRTED